jgi:hypothetical protein
MGLPTLVLFVYLFINIARDWPGWTRWIACGLVYGVTAAWRQRREQAWQRWQARHQQGSGTATSEPVH